MIWRRNTRLTVLSEASATIFLWCIGVGALWFVLPGLAEKLTGNLAYVGLLLSIPAIVAFMWDMPLGDLCDRADKKKILVLGLFLMFLLGFALPLINSVAGFVVFLVVLGVLHPISYTVTTAYVMEVTPKKYSSSFLGAYTSFIHLGFVLGALAGGYIVADALSANLSRIGLLYSGACIAAAAFALTLKKEGVQSISRGFYSVLKEDKIFIKEISDFKKLGFTGVAIIGMALLFGTFDGIVWTLEPLLYQELSLKSVQGGMILAGFVVPLILFEAPAGYLADKIGKRRVLAYGLLLAGFFSYLFSTAETFPALVAYAFMATSGLALAWPAAEGILADHTKKSESGEFVGVWRTAADLGYITGPLAGGFIAYSTSISTVFALAGAALITVGVSVFFFKRSG